MSSNEQKDEGDANILVTPANTQEELIHIIQMSLHNIVTRVNTLSKRAVDIIDEIFEETDKLSFKVTVLEEQVIQKTNAITYKDQNGGLSLRITESKTFQSTTIQTQQVYSSKQVPVKMGERHDTHGLTLPMNRSSPFRPADTGGLEASPDASYCFDLYKDKTVPKTEEEMGAKPKQKQHKQKQHKDHSNKPASVPQIQLMEDGVSVYLVPAACSEASRSHADQPDESSSFSSFPVREINKLVTRAVGEVISSSHYLPTPESREARNSVTYVRYGTGRGEELKPQPRIHVKTKVFVSPTAPASAPPLPADWLAALKAPKVETPSSSVRLPTQLQSPVLGTPAATAAACLPGAPDGAVPMTPPKGDFSTPASEPLPYDELTTDDVLAQAEYQGMPPPLSSSAVTSASVQTRATVTHLRGSMSVVQSSTASVMKLPKSSIPSSPRSSLPSSPRSSLPSSQSNRIPPPRYPVTRPPRSSIPQNASPLSSISSCPQTSRSWIPSPRNSLSPCTRSSDTTRSRRSEAQSSRPSAAQSQRSSTARSTRHLIPPQQNSSSVQSAKPFTLQSVLPFVQSPSCTLGSSGLSATPSAPAPVNATFRQTPPDIPVIAKIKNVVMAAIKKTVLLHNTEDQ